jgi:hypothetical protein
MTATYVFCVVAAPRAPRINRAPRGLKGMGPVRVLDIDRGLFAVVADAPLSQYGEGPLNASLSNLDWVSRAAVAHERVIEHFIDAAAVLPMKLFTMFAGDDRALTYLRGERSRLSSTVKRVANQQEWGVRVLLDRARAAKRPVAAKARASGGLAYLAMKKAQRDAAAELAVRAHDTVADLFDRLSSKARDARRRSIAELPAQGGSLLLDAAFLVPRTRAASFRAVAAREARALASQGYAVTLTGPWPPYSFVQDA